MHCHRYMGPAVSRRDMLLRCGNGFGTALAAAALFREAAFGADRGRCTGWRGTCGQALECESISPRPPHFAAKARSVIFLFMDGGPSQVDTFDPKPRLDREHGQPIKVKTQPTQFNNVGNVLACPWKFRQYGESGIPVSDLFPHVGRLRRRPGDRPLDGLELLRAHERQLLPPHRQRPAGPAEHGAWVTYGLGSECQDLPGFVVLNGGLIPPGGLDCFNSGFLPASYQGSVFRPSAAPVANISPTEPTPSDQRRKLELLRALDEGVLGRIGHHDGSRRRSPTTSWPSACSRPCPS